MPSYVSFRGDFAFVFATGLPPGGLPAGNAFFGAGHGDDPSLTRSENRRPLPLSSFGISALLQ